MTDGQPARLFTPRSTAVSVLGVLMLVLGFALGYPTLVVIGFGCLLILIMGLLLLGRRPGGQLSREISPEQLTRGERVGVQLRAGNRGLTPIGAVDVIDRVAGKDVELRLPAVPPRGEATISYSFLTRRRGELQFGPVRLERRDPFGLFLREREFGEIRTALVHPRVLPMSASRSGRIQGMEGGSADRDVLGSNQFSTLRDYVIGDELRQVHWRSSARVGKLMVKQLVDNPLPRALLVLDTDPAAYPANAGGVEFGEEAVDVAASLCAALVAEGLPVTLRYGASDTVIEALRAEDMPRILDALAVAEFGTPTRPPARLRNLILASRATSLYVVTGSHAGGTAARVLEALGLVGEALLVQVGAAPGEMSPRRGMRVVTGWTADDFALTPAQVAAATAAASPYRPMSTGVRT